MPQTFVKIRGIDPLLLRDGRPFTSADGGLTAVSLPLPRPTTLAGFVRSQVGDAMGWDWKQPGICERARGVSVHGPLLLYNDHIVLPAPLDALLREDATPVRLVPEENSLGGCDLPEGLAPLSPIERVVGKPPHGYHFWPQKTLLDWLEGKPVSTLERIGGLVTEERIGIAVESRRSTIGRRAKEGMLYTTHLRGFESRTGTGDVLYELVAKLKKTEALTFLTVGHLGGERRLTCLEELPDTPDIWPRCPDTLKQTLASSKRIKLTLATPAVFSGGWKPGWLETAGTGALELPGGIANIRLRLVAAAVGRREPLNGWSIRETKRRQTRWMVPAGATYFFEAEGPTEQLWERCWLQPVSDLQRDRTDGLGLALWGVW